MTHGFEIHDTPLWRCTSSPCGIAVSIQAMDAERPASTLVADLPDEGGGVDKTLIDALLALTPEERLRQNDRMLRSIEELRNGFRLRRSDHVTHGTGANRG